jgi:hypothetical protein
LILDVPGLLREVIRLQSQTPGSEKSLGAEAGLLN